MPARFQRSRVGKRAELLAPLFPQRRVSVVDRLRQQTSNTQADRDDEIEDDQLDDATFDYGEENSNSDGNSVDGPQDLQELTTQTVEEVLSKDIPTDDDANTYPDPNDEEDNADSTELEFPSEEFLNSIMPPPIGTTIENTVLPSEDQSEPVSYNRSSKPMTTFEQFLASYAETYNISRKSFAMLREGLGLIQSLKELADLPRDVGTLKRRMVAQLPLVTASCACDSKMCVHRYFDI
ncbi:hypothetical protein GMDG_05886 [Pseudogymnoascus destructans 20631-21]|uniref:Uncharacterized protein n=1 Tax=Pseudogymnoascus destructans (strain ATCC MYA-4855 / 20631-21) TaxID=658429 RepID=L8FTJ9_PSED2|nr:hypothetical protein GMDG_05886 [Pseudogymnoascus destructans 20631-21]